MKPIRGPLTAYYRTADPSFKFNLLALGPNLIWLKSSVATLRNKKPSWANKKPKETQGQISIDLAKIPGKILLFLSETQLSRKNSFLSAKISYDFFVLVICAYSDFYPHFQIFNLFRP